MKTEDRKKRRLKDELILIFVSIMEFILILIIFLGDFAGAWLYLLFAGVFLIFVPILGFFNSLAKGYIYRECPDCCFSILQNVMDRGRAADAKILELSYYMSERKLKDDDKLVIKLMLRILDGEKTPYDIPVETDIPKDVVSGMKQGDTIPVLIDRLDPNKVEINLEMLSKEPDPKPAAI